MRIRRYEEKSAHSVIGPMIGSSLFAVPKKRKAGNIDPNLEREVELMMRQWSQARPTEEAKAEYYSRMETEALRCVTFKGRYERLMAFEKYVVDFTLKTWVSKTFLSLLNTICPMTVPMRRHGVTGLLP